jgi:hypothetical protein
MLTTRKGNKRFAYYDLKLTIAWEAAPVAEAPSSAQAAGEAAEAGGGGGQAAGGDVGAGQEAGAGSAGKPSVTGEISLAEFGSGSDHDDLEVTVTATGALPRRCSRRCSPCLLGMHGGSRSLPRVRCRAAIAVPCLLGKEWGR